MPLSPAKDTPHANAQAGRPVVACWSGGKDSCFALYEILKTRRVEALLTTLTRDYDRISMHGVRRGLLQPPAERLGLKLSEDFISAGASNDGYEARMGGAFPSIREGRTAESVF